MVTSPKRSQLVKVQYWWFNPQLRWLFNPICWCLKIPWCSHDSWLSPMKWHEITIRRFPEMGLPLKSSFLNVVFQEINHSFWGIPIYLKTTIDGILTYICPKMEVPTIYKAYVRAMVLGIYPPNMAEHILLTYLHGRILLYSVNLPAPWSIWEHHQSQQLPQAARNAANLASLSAWSQLERWGYHGLIEGLMANHMVKSWFDLNHMLI